MKNRSNPLSRRQFLQTSLSGSLLFSGVTVAENSTTTGIDGLIDALRATRKTVCVTAADRLQRNRTGAGNFDLHLRSADLDQSDAQLIAQALQILPTAKGPVLRSFSMSYNPGLTDAGVAVLAPALPASVTELGLVGCDITDDGGLALLRRGQQATALRMMCIENNRFSPAIREALLALRHDRSGLVVIV